MTPTVGAKDLLWDFSSYTALHFFPFKDVSSLRPANIHLLPYYQQQHVALIHDCILYLQSSQTFNYNGFFKK